MEHLEEQKKKSDAEKGEADLNHYVDDEFESDADGSKDEEDAAAGNQINGRNTPDIWANDDDDQDRKSVENED